MAIEVLYVEGCPGYPPLSRLRELVAVLGVHDTIASRPVATEEQARTMRFLGSPTVRVDGRDVEPGAESREEHGITCRLYSTSDGSASAPPDDMILSALRNPQCSGPVRSSRAPTSTASEPAPLTRSARSGGAASGRCRPDR